MATSASSENHPSLSEFRQRFTARWRKQTKKSRPDQPERTSNELEDIFARLVGYPTVTGNYQANHDALDYISDFLAARGLHVKRFNWHNVESMVATTRRTKKPKLLLAGHLDVLPADEADFSLRTEGERYYGRGTLDMKFAIAGYMKAIDTLGDDLTNYDIGVMITTDEEAGGTDGVARLLEEGYVPSVAVLPDGGDNWQIQLFIKGFLYLGISTTGKTAHGSRPWLGENAIYALTDIIHEVQALFPTLAPETNTLNIGRISGGRAINQVASSAEALFDIRVMNEQEKARLLKEIQTIAKSHHADVNVVIDGMTCEFELGNPYIARFASIIEDVTGIHVTGSSTLGSSDSRFFAAKNVPCISIYPEGGNHHGPGEWIARKGLQQFCEVITWYIQQPEFKYKK